MKLKKEHNISRIIIGKKLLVVGFILVIIGFIFIFMSKKVSVDDYKYILYCTLECSLSLGIILQVFSIILIYGLQQCYNQLKRIINDMFFIVKPIFLILGILCVFAYIIFIPITVSNIINHVKDLVRREPTTSLATVTSVYVEKGVDSYSDNASYPDDTGHILFIPDGETKEHEVRITGSSIWFYSLHEGDRIRMVWWYNTGYLVRYETVDEYGNTIETFNPSSISLRDN